MKSRTRWLKNSGCARYIECPTWGLVTLSAFLILAENNCITAGVENITPAPSAAANLGFSSLRRFRFARNVKCDRLADEHLEGGLVNVSSFVDVDSAPYVSIETRVDETCRI